MANDSQALAFLLGRVGRGVLDEVLAGGRRDDLAELQAVMFEEVGSPTGSRIATVLRDDPDSGMQFIESMGGANAVYSHLLRQRDLARAEGAAQAENAALVNTARLQLQGLEPPPAPGQGGGMPVGPLQGAGGIATQPSDVQRLGGLAPIVAQLEAVQRAGGNVSQTIQSLNTLSELSTPKLYPALALWKQIGINPDNYTGESLGRAVEYLQSDAGRTSPQGVYKILQRRTDEVKAPSGYYFATGADGKQKLVPFEGGTVAMMKSALLQSLKENGKWTPQEQTLYDAIVRMDPLDQIMRRGLGELALPGAAPTPGGTPEPGAGFRGPPSNEDVDSAIEDLRVKTGRNPEPDELSVYLRGLGFEVK